jgi:hypothetical protein
VSQFNSSTEVPIWFVFSFEWNGMCVSSIQGLPCNNPSRITCTKWQQWPHVLRHAWFWSVRTLGSWVQITSRYRCMSSCPSFLLSSADRGQSLPKDLICFLRNHNFIVWVKGEERCNRIDSITHTWITILFMSMEWDYVSERRSPTGLLFIPQFI